MSENFAPEAVWVDDGKSKRLAIVTYHPGFLGLWGSVYWLDTWVDPEMEHLVIAKSARSTRSPGTTCTGPADRPTPPRPRKIITPNDPGTRPSPHASPFPAGAPAAVSRTARKGRVRTRAGPDREPFSGGLLQRWP